MDKMWSGGTGTSAVMALLHARGELKIGEEFVHESIVGSKFVGRLVKEVPIESPHHSWSADSTVAVVPEISGAKGFDLLRAVSQPCIAGSAWITQYCQATPD